MIVRNCCGTTAYKETKMQLALSIFTAVKPDFLCCCSDVNGVCFTLLLFILFYKGAFFMFHVLCTDIV